MRNPRLLQLEVNVVFHENLVLKYLKLFSDVLFNAW